MSLANKYFVIEAKIHLFDSDKGRKSFISDGYRPHIYFGYSDPSNPNFASDCVIRLQNKEKLFPGEVAVLCIYVLNFSHLKHLLEENVKLKMKEGIRFIGDGTITKIIGERKISTNTP